MRNAKNDNGSQADFASFILIPLFNFAKYNVKVSGLNGEKFEKWKLLLFEELEIFLFQWFNEACAKNIPIN